MLNREDKIKRVLTRNVVEIIKRDHLENNLRAGKKLRVKLGIDPTSPDLHLGHAVLLHKLREFQELGCIIVLIIGDFTARIGDPSGRSESRPPLSESEVRRNMRTYLKQASSVLDIKKVEIAHNSTWFKKAALPQILDLARAGTIQQVLRRADFSKRIKSGENITFLELLYPLFQGYDSVKIRADLEIGGTDQTFNLLMGRKVQRYFGLKEQDVLTVELLEGTDGLKKMSKSVGNYIGLTEKPAEMVGKIMRIPDKLIHKYLFLCTELEADKIQKLEKQLPPRDLKLELAREIVKIHHGEKAAEKAVKEFEKLFSKKELSGKLPSLKSAAHTNPIDLILRARVAESKSKSWQLVSQGGFEIDCKVIKNPREEIIVKGGEVVRMGKKKIFRLKL